jgi:hypothetical protein
MESLEQLLSKYHNGECTSRKIATSEHHQRLTIEQKELLIGQINRLADRSIPTTDRMIKSMAEEIIRERMGKN